MARIFISYKRADKEKVFTIKEEIESALGERCWIDIDGIESDAQFKNVIISAINDCEIVLFMYSKTHSKIVDFEKDWTVRELNFASKKNKRIVFINLDGSALTDAFEFDYGTKQQLDARNQNNIKRLITDLRSWLRIDDSVLKAQEEARRKYETERRNAEKQRNDAIKRKRREQQKREFKNTILRYFHNISWLYSIGLFSVFVIFAILFLNQNKILHFFKNRFKTSDTLNISEHILPEKTIESEVKFDNLETIFAKIPEDYILIPKGDYTKYEYNEKLQNEYLVSVTVDSFYICKSELTQGEYVRIMGDIEERNYRFEVTTEYPSQYKSFKDEQLPVLGTYVDFVRYCNKRSEEEGYDGFYTLDGNSVIYKPDGNGYRLLSEDEWAFAALSGKNKPRYKYIGGDKLSEVAWYGGNSGNKPHQVCLKKPNDIGLYDMAGNVDEMLQSTYKGNHLVAGNSFIQWSYSGREFNEKSNGRFSWEEGHDGTRIALIPKNFSKD